MTPEQFLRQLQRQGPASAYLFIGPERYYRDVCRRALIESFLPAEEREQGLVQHDLSEVSLTEALDDASTLSLFASKRLIWFTSAEAALPKTRGGAGAATEAGGSPRDGSGLLERFLREPPPATVAVFESSRYEFEGDDRPRMERVQQFFRLVPNQVEFRPLSIEQARALAQDLAREAGLKIGISEIGLLVEALGGDASRIAAEIEKLSLYAGTERCITAADLAKLTPNAQENTIFQLVAALGAGNRSRSLAVLDALVREGEYLPLALTFLATQFRLALVAREANLRSSSEIVSYFSRNGIRMWRDRAEQLRQTLQAFSKEKLELALQKTFAADRGLRDARPDDRIVMEELILSLTK